MDLLWFSRSGVMRHEQSNTAIDLIRGATKLPQADGSEHSMNSAISAWLGCWICVDR